MFLDQDKNNSNNVKTPSHRSARWRIAIGILVLVGALSYFAFLAFDSATVYFYTVAEMKEHGPTSPGEIVRVNGKLLQESFIREDGETSARFTLTDGTESIYALHDGVIPDLFFNEHSEIILEGIFGTDGIFVSRSVIVKCPSKYEAVEEESD